MPSLFSVPFHLVLYQMYFLSLLVPFIYFLCTMSPFSLCSYSFIILFLIFISSFCKIIFPCFHSRSPFHIFCLHISAYHIFGLSRYFHRSCIVILPAILFVLYYSKSGLPCSVKAFVSVLSRIINSAFRLQFLLCLDIIVVLFQLISSLLSFPLFLCRILNLNATHTNFHTFWSTLLVCLHSSSFLFSAVNAKRMAAQLSQLWILFVVSLIQNIWQCGMHEKYGKPTYNEVPDLITSFCEVPKLLAVLLYFSSWWTSSYRRLIWNKNTTLCTSL